MEPLRARKKKNSPKVNLIFSVAFHGLIVLVLAFWAAHEGVLGTKLKEITATLVPKEKPPEPEKPPPPPPAPPRDETPKPAEPPKVAAAAPPQIAAAPPPASSGPAAVAPAAAIPADFAFSDGAKVVETSTNAAMVWYKNQVEYTLRSNWERPTDVTDDSYVAEVEVSVDGSGRITGSNWKKGSGNPRWDDSVKKAIASTKSLDRPPPAGFPGTFLVRFDVQPATEPLLQ